MFFRICVLHLIHLYMFNDLKYTFFTYETIVPSGFCKFIFKTIAHGYKTMIKHSYLIMTVMMLATSVFLVLILYFLILMLACYGDSAFSIMFSQHVLKSPARIPGWSLGAAGTPGCCDCQTWQQSRKCAATAASVFWWFPSRLPEEVPHDEPETFLQPRGPRGGAQQCLCHQDVSQPLHTGNASCLLSDQSTKGCLLSAFL